jgi:hypothetical protein
VANRSSLGLLTAVLVAGGTVAACAGDAWLHESNPAGNHLFDPRLATEVRSFWLVSAAQIDTAAQLLEARAVVSISPERAADFIGRAPSVTAGESLFLIRAIDVADATPLRVYRLGAWVEVTAGTRSSCFVSRPTIRRQPIVVPLPQAPTRLKLSYACNE